MARPLDTSVRGSPGTCTEFADWLDRFSGAVHAASEDARSARSTAEGRWHGPASDAFRDAVHGIPDDADTVGRKASDSARRLRDFAHALDTVAAKMADAVTAAHRAGLRVEGPFIFPPDPPGPAPQPPGGALSPEEAQQHAEQNAVATERHWHAVDAYNVKADAFNRISETVADARKIETDAHRTLDQSLAKAGKEVHDLPTLGITGISWAATYVKSFHGAAEQLFEKSDEILRVGKVYSNFNAGGLINLSAEEKELLKWGADHADALHESYETKASQLEKWVNKVPRQAREFIAQNPGQALADGSKYFKYTKGILSGLPYVGTAVSAVSQSIQAMGGEKSWGRAATDFGAETAGGAVGGWAGGALAGAVMGSEVPGFGTVVGGAIGGFLGTGAADAVVDRIADSDEYDRRARETYGEMDMNNPMLHYPG